MSSSSAAAIYGLTIACDAAQRGLSVALIERHDFGSGSSFNHLRTIHGGLRYLQTLDIARARESISERRTLARIAPAAIQPLPFVLPLTRSLTKGPLAMRLGFALDRLVAVDRNAGIAASHHLPPGRVRSRREVAGALPRPRGGEIFDGAAVWYDYVTVQADRLTLAWALAAARARRGARELRRGHRADDRSPPGHWRSRQRRAQRPPVRNCGAANRQRHRRRDRSAADAGASVDRHSDAEGDEPGHQPCRHRRGGRRSGRVRAGTCSWCPWQNRALFGTWESPNLRAADDVGVQEADVASFLDDLNHGLSGSRPGEDRRDAGARGVVPAATRPAAASRLDGSDQIRDHAADGITGLLSVAGTKYTTARAVAERITDGLMTRLGRTAVRLPHRVDAPPLVAAGG